MKNKVKIKGTLKTYLQASLYLGVLLCFISIALWFIDFRAAALVTGFSVLYMTVIAILLHRNKPIILNELISFATEYGQIQHKLYVIWNCLMYCWMIPVRSFGRTKHLKRLYIKEKVIVNLSPHFSRK